jgi:hypothetical protein
VCVCASYASRLFLFLFLSMLFVLSAFLSSPPLHSQAGSAGQVS